MKSQMKNSVVRHFLPFCLSYIILNGSENARCIRETVAPNWRLKDVKIARLWEDSNRLS